MSDRDELARGELREFIWERCEADDNKTDEIMEKIDEWHAKKIEPIKKIYEEILNGPITYYDYDHVILRWAEIRQVCEGGEK